jgi:hypothetical protein
MIACPARSSSVLGVAFLILFVGSAACNAVNNNLLTTSFGNPIQRENALPGSTAWQSPNFSSYEHSFARLDQAKRDHAARSVADSGSNAPRQAAWISPKQLEGYAGRTSINQGESITLHISSAYARYDLKVYRSGWYGGTGSSFKYSALNLAGTAYPSPSPDSYGMVDARWPVAHTIQTDASWTSGVYLVWLAPSGTRTNVSYIIFVVRNDSQVADILYPIATSTYQAYNAWGGKSLYDYNSPDGRASKVSYNRPYDHNDGAGLFFPGDYHMVRWLEKEGYNVTYATSEDIQTNPNLMNNRKVFLSNFHDEYWSMPMRQHLTTWRDAGKDLAFFDANNIYWQIRYEPGPDGTPNRVIVCFKSAALDPMSTSGTPHLTTVKFRDAPVNQPENELLGTMFDNALGFGHAVPWVVSNASHWIYQGTGLQNGDSIPKLVGYEFDRAWANGMQPPNLEIIATSPVVFPALYINSVHHAAVYVAQSGAYVFNAGTNYWPYFLFGSWDIPQDARVEQMTRNILNRMIHNGTAVTTTPSSTSTPSPTFTAVPATWTSTRMPSATSAPLATSAPSATSAPLATSVPSATSSGIDDGELPPMATATSLRLDTSPCRENARSHNRCITFLSMVRDN